jgi:hypothetical protein
VADKHEIEDIVAMLDQFVENGGGHMNIQVDDPNDLSEIKVDTFKSSDCSNTDTACSIPTLQQGFDEL